MNVIVVENKEQLQDAFKIRTIVFVEEQNVPPEEEIDQFEKESTHFVVYSDEKDPIAAGRFREHEGYGKIERICVLPSYRKYGIGKLIMEQIIAYAKENHFSKLKLNAQTHAIPFYEKLGFRAVSDIFMDAGIPHKTMTMNI
ncbi:GNAT family N-acetyltransferase [Caldibacillus lycopersici]|uniref:GNAT family N-acetyltransferase n=1 Tax=Perspicuibacillus lycopersici TaxID=1325689 RepID=A0AAE3IPY0_9BACI|nr:GNAT family N-acetyltransferase [Perspicuibacillus lycopersici]MCU9612413.1 GNAT family N-acetyltransferase [Perspicuibacillus lycopersici]